MGWAYSVDLRERVVAAFDRAGMTDQEAAAIFKIGEATVRRWKRLRNRGEVTTMLGALDLHGVRAMMTEDAHLSCCCMPGEPLFFSYASRQHEESARPLRRAP